MAGRASWLVDGQRIATKIKSASGTLDPQKVVWRSNPARACPNCQHIIDNSDVSQEWPGLPRGVKFDPSDQEIIWHLMSKVGEENLKPHPFIDEFILTVDKDDGICYTHPRNLPGVKQDGSVSHFFHRAIKAYNTGTRKRRKIHGDDAGDVRWHKTGRTKAVMMDGVQKGCKKIMVLYVTVRGGKAEKTNWVMHQYHLGTEEDEKDGEYVISKIFYQQQQPKQGDKSEQDLPEITDTITKADPVTPMSVIPKQGDKSEQDLPEITDTITKADPVTPMSVIPEPPHSERGFPEFELGQDDVFNRMDASAQDVVYETQPERENPCCNDQPNPGNHDNPDNNDKDHEEDNPKWWEGESQCLLDSQQLVEALSLCDDLLQSQSPNRDENGNGAPKSKSCFSDYAQLGAEHLKKDLEECQNLELDPANIELDTPPEFRLSQLEFGSQDSFIAWGGGKEIG